LGETHQLVLRPVLLAGLLDHYGQKGPAEIPAKREFTYRFVQFQAEQAGVALRFPAAHPFNPLAALRLCIAAGSTPDAVSAVLDWIWSDGKCGDSIDALTPLAERLGIADPTAAVVAPEVKAALRDNYDSALAAGVFGVPTAVVQGECFWGLDALPMLQAFLRDPGMFARGPYPQLAGIPAAASRRV
jgi:2-hydroxychromene-2-carboxylate isomerase